MFVFGCRTSCMQVHVHGWVLCAVVFVKKLNCVFVLSEFGMPLFGRGAWGAWGVGGVQVALSRRWATSHAHAGYVYAARVACVSLPERAHNACIRAPRHAHMHRINYGSGESILTWCGVGGGEVWDLCGVPDCGTPPRRTTCTNILLLWFGCLASCWRGLVLCSALIDYMYSI